uniref:Probable U2 small nuclear ribonucleoprotein A' n=1 Tax=Caenorhabditis tropicalis TaxID=1561998 RepID=A0A1I7TYZ2_9PELO
MVRLTTDLFADCPQFVNSINMREINLRGQKIPVIENMGVTRDQFDVIDLTDNDIRKLDNFPTFTRLNTLYLHNNRINFIASDIASKLPNLKTLALTNNNLCELGDIEPLSECKKLEFVTFIGNPITHKDNYRMYIIYKLPSVRVIDFNRVRLTERDAARKMFRGKSGKKARDAIQKSILTDDPSEVEVNENSGAGSGDKLNDEDREKIKEAIKNAKSLGEVNYLQSILASGRVPEKGWNRQMDQSNFEESMEF